MTLDQAKVQRALRSATERFAQWDDLPEVHRKLFSDLRQAAEKMQEALRAFPAGTGEPWATLNACMQERALGGAAPAPGADMTAHRRFDAFAMVLSLGDMNHALRSRGFVKLSGPAPDQRAHLWIWFAADAWLIEFPGDLPSAAEHAAFLKAVREFEFPPGIPMRPMTRDFVDGALERWRDHRRDNGAPEPEAPRWPEPVSQPSVTLESQWPPRPATVKD